MNLSGKTIGFALTGSFCTFARVFPQAEALVRAGARVIPVLSFNAWALDTRFFKAEQVRARLREITGEEPLHTLEAVEPFGPKKALDLLVIAPCTGNTLAKLAAGIADTPVTLAAKSHLRNERPILIAVSTNDALAAAAKNIGALSGARDIITLFRTARTRRTGSRVRWLRTFDKIPECACAALAGVQTQPMLV